MITQIMHQHSTREKLFEEYLAADEILTLAVPCTEIVNFTLSNSIDKLYYASALRRYSYNQMG